MAAPVCSSSRWLTGLCTLALTACGAPAEMPLQPASSARAAISTQIPEGWSVTETYKLADPAGVGMSATSPDGRELGVYVSLTALEAFLGDDPGNTTRYDFPHIQGVLRELDLLPIAEDCTSEGVRPVEEAGYYGRVRLMRDCSGAGPRRPELEVRSVVVDARRTTVVWVSVSDADRERALSTVSAVLRHLEVDRDAVPTRVRSNVVVGG